VSSATLFDAYVIVDWSAAAVPKTGRDSIWATALIHDGSTWLENPPTRASAAVAIREKLAQLVERGLRVLVGFDFPYGHPAGFAAAAGRDGASPWRDNWDEISALVVDDADNRNERFRAASELNARRGDHPGPFWGSPPGQVTSHLQAKGCGFPWQPRNGLPLQRLRITERRVRGVQETWKLLGSGCVGSQALVGIPVVSRLRFDADLAQRSRVWPFETGFTASPLRDGALVLHAEIWPGVVANPRVTHDVRDAAQVLSLAQHLAELDAAGGLGVWFDRPSGLGGDELERCVAEEGWILGAGLPAAS
jgi:hypothetical protein